MTGIAVGAALLGGAAIGLAATVAVGALLLAWATATGGRPPVGLVVACLVAAALGTWRGVEPPRPDPVAWADRAVGVAGRVVSIPSVTGRSQRFVLEIGAVWDGERRFPAAGRLDVTSALAPRVEIGDDVWLTGVVTPLADHVPGYAAYLRTLGCGGTLFGRSLEVDAVGRGWRRPLAVFRFRIDGLFGRAAPGDAGALLAGLVTGDDHALSRERRAAFVRTGTSHLTAVSGSNVALLVTLASLGASGRRRRRLVWQVGLVVLVWVYAALVGLPPPATRAALVATGAVFAVRTGRRPDLLTLLVISGALMVVVDPSVLWSLSFQLSFAASLGLVAAVGAVAPIGVGGWLRAALVTTVAAQIATLPLLVAAFGEASLASVPANVLLAPLVLLAFPLAFVSAAVGVAAPSMGEAIAAIAAIPVDGMLVVVDALGGHPAAVLPIERPEAIGTGLLTVICGGTLCVWSPEGRIWLTRTLSEARAAGRGLVAMTVVVAVLALAIVTVAFAIR